MRFGVVMLLLTAIAPGTQHHPAFRVQTELVRVDVLVERAGRPIEGLTADSFVVEDNGVHQSIQLLPATGAVAVATVLDVSGSMTAEKLRNAETGVGALRAALHERDSHTLYAFAGDVRRIAPDRPQPSESVASATRQSGGVHTSLLDALFAAILQNGAVEGPKVLTVLTDGRNNTSWLSAQAAIDAAIRHETVIYPVAVIDDRRPDRFEVPSLAGDDALRLLQTMAERTGGRLMHASWSRDLAPVFDGIVREYRQRYILAFTPEGVGRGDGWHRLEVRLHNTRGRVHGRSGYWSR